MGKVLTGKLACSVTGIVYPVYLVIRHLSPPEQLPNLDLSLKDGSRFLGWHCRISNFHNHCIHSLLKTVFCFSCQELQDGSVIIDCIERHCG